MITGITIIGAGKVGAALAQAFFLAGIKVDTIISKTQKSAESLAKLTNSTWSTDPAVEIKSDFIILAVPDNEIGGIAASLGNIGKSVLLHTAGSFGIDVLGSHSCKGKGVFYPLQTFTTGRNVDIGIVPILIEGDNHATEEKVSQLAESISDRVFSVSAEDRRMIHLSAVFVCNFVNHIFFAGEKITSRTSIPYSVLDPLISETVSKAREIGPAASQTGPAIRNDISTIEKHIDLLSYSPEFKNIYKAITRSIIKNKESE